MKDPNRFYTYAYLREDGTPYYIGKGKDGRVYHKSHNVNVPSKERILFLKQNLSEEDAIKHEIYMIYVFGRKDLGNGILRNMTSGGEGMSGYKHSEEFIERMRTNNPSKDPRVSKIKSQKLSGKNNPMYGRTGENHHNYGKSRTKESIEKRVKSFCKNTYAIISPNGEKFITNNMSKFCTEHNLGKGNMSSVILGKSKHYKGWVCCIMKGEDFPRELIKYESKKYCIVSPDGKKYITENLNKFSLEQKLQHSEMYRLVNKKIPSYKGWTFCDCDG